MKTLFIIAEMQEAKPLIEHYGMKSQSLMNVDVYSSEKYQLIVTGPGVSNVISSLSKAMQLGLLDSETRVLNVGYAGAKGLEVGSVVGVKTCCCLEFPVKAKIALNNRVNLSEQGVDCYTSFDFVEKADTIVEPALFDMELAYICRFVYKSLSSIKIVSDNLNYTGFQDFNADDAWSKVIEKVELLLKKGG